MNRIASNLSVHGTASGSVSSALILVADGHPELADGLFSYLERSGLRALCVDDGHKALQRHRDLHPDLVLLDVALPGLDGWQTLLEMRRRGDTPVIMCSDQEQDRLACLRMGADDYIAKPFNPAEAVARMMALLRRCRVDDGGGQNVLHVAPLRIDFDSHEVVVMADGTHRAVSLTLAEFKLLAHLARTPRRVASRAELLYACLPEGDSLERTVDSHISRLRRKLQQAGAGGMPVAVRGVGYKLWSR